MALEDTRVKERQRGISGRLMKLARRWSEVGRRTPEAGRLVGVVGAGGRAEGGEWVGVGGGGAGNR